MNKIIIILSLLFTTLLANSNINMTYIIEAQCSSSGDFFSYKKKEDYSKLVTIHDENLYNDIYKYKEGDKIYNLDKFDNKFQEFQYIDGLKPRFYFENYEVYPTKIFSKGFSIYAQNSITIQAIYYEVVDVKNGAYYISEVRKNYTMPNMQISNDKYEECLKQYQSSKKNKYIKDTVLVLICLSLIIIFFSSLKKTIGSSSKQVFFLSLKWALVAILFFTIVFYLVNETNFTESEHFTRTEITNLFLYPYFIMWIISGIYLLISIYKKFFAKKIAKK